ncbi:MAG TPA: hypothetical protein VGQ24_16960 [Gemmatimonadales bacterium]|nr:hypothetical protein [Gemmatimonadales bacterium]
MSHATDVERGQAILSAIARRLQTVAIGDPAVQSITFTVHFRSGGGWPRGVTMRVEVSDDLPQAGTNGHAPTGTLDACGPTRAKE